MTDDTGGRPTAVDRDQTSLEEAVAKLRVLAEENAHTISLIAEGHGATLDSHSAKLDALSARLDSLGTEVITALKPLHQIKDFIERVADDHELRITALEKHSNLLE